jgi:hypothetical protein
MIHQTAIWALADTGAAASQPASQAGVSFTRPHCACVVCSGLRPPPSANISVRRTQWLESGDLARF